MLCVPRERGDRLRARLAVRVLRRVLRRRYGLRLLMVPAPDRQIAAVLPSLPPHVAAQLLAFLQVSPPPDIAVWIGLPREGELEEPAELVRRALAEVAFAQYGPPAGHA